MSDIIGIKPLQFVHVLDLNTNIVRLEVGPLSLCLQTNEVRVAGPLPFVFVKPEQYCVVNNPCIDYVHGQPCKLKFGHSDVRFHKEPFPLYPGEILVGYENILNEGDHPKVTVGRFLYHSAMKPIPVIAVNCAIRLKAKVDHVVDGVARKAGDIWQLQGPRTYRPTPEAEIVGMIDPLIIKPNEAVRLRAVQDCIDVNGKKRVTDEEWLIEKTGAYLCGVFEEIVNIEIAQTLTKDMGLHLRATQNIENFIGKRRPAGDEWLVTGEEIQSFIPPIGVAIINRVRKQVVKKGQFCVVVNPADKNGHTQLGKREVRIGICSFFLHPGERLEHQIQPVYVLSDDHGLVIQAQQHFKDTTLGKEIMRKPGDKWMLRGPRTYVPSVEVKVLARREAIPLSENEGVYVRDIQTGLIRAEMGQQAYMIKEHEWPFPKELPPLVETLLENGGGIGDESIRKMAYFEQSIDPNFRKRDPTRVVTFRCPGNTACQVNNYQDKTSRVVFGPDLVVLGPHESFDVLSLSAGKPKKENALKTLCLMLGPDFITDIIQVETADHARLQIKLAFNNHFEVASSDPVESKKLFSVPDFIGFACREVASRIRGSVAQVPFDEFHRHSSQVIQHAVFGVEADGKPKKTLKFPANNLVISGVDIQSIEPVDVKMRESLMKSVQMAIEIATKSIEAAASHEASRTEQIAKGNLERQKLQNEKEAEKERCRLCELQAITSAVESTGQAVAEAQARTEKIMIECQSEIEAAQLRAQASDIEHLAKIESQLQANAAEMIYKTTQSDLEIEKTKALADLEVGKFSQMIDALGKDTFAAIAEADPDSQGNLLGSLGIENTIFQGGKSPFNLFN